jgi:hypothetical protein
MLAAPLPAPALHGALGPWDEIITLIPVITGAILFLYLYFTARSRRAGEDKPPAEDPPAAPE